MKKLVQEFMERDHSGRLWHKREHNIKNHHREICCNVTDWFSTGSSYEFCGDNDKCVVFFG